MTAALAAVLLLVLNQDPPKGTLLDAEQIQGRVRAVVDRGIPEVGPDLRASYVDRLSAPLLRAPDRDRVPELLDQLPRALEFHTLQVRMYEIRTDVPGLPPVTLPPPLMEEGYQMQVDYLAARVDRAAQLTWSDGTKAAISVQIEALAGGAKEALVSKLPGDAGRRLADREVDPIRDTWLKSLDLPFNRFLDTPLPAEELNRILGRMKEVAASSEPIVLTDAQAADPEALRTRGVKSLLDQILGAASESMTYCYRQFAETDHRLEEWGRRARASCEQEAQKVLRSYKPVPAPAAKTSRTAVNGADAAAPSARLVVGSPEGTRADPAFGGPDSPSPRRTAVISVILLLAAVLVGSALVRSGKRSASA